MLATHISEAVYLARTRLRKHQVKTGSRIWWSWVISNFIEGVSAIQRFDAVVQDKEEKKRKKH